MSSGAVSQSRNGDAKGIPDAWPALLSRDQLRAYLGGVCDATLRKICPVPAVDLGANVLKYRRDEIDAWLDGLDHRLPLPRGGEQDASQPLEAANDRALTAIERARSRAERGSRWRKSATSSASAKAS